MKQSNKRGFVTFAKSSAPELAFDAVLHQLRATTPGSTRRASRRSARSTTGMDVVDKLYGGYGRTNVPDQGRITAEGNAYLQKEYPKLDYVKTATIEK